MCSTCFITFISFISPNQDVLIWLIHAVADRYINNHLTLNTRTTRDLVLDYSASSMDAAATQILFKTTMCHTHVQPCSSERYYESVSVPQECYWIMATIHYDVMVELTFDLLGIKCQDIFIILIDIFVKVFSSSRYKFFRCLTNEYHQRSHLLLRSCGHEHTHSHTLMVFSDLKFV